METAVEVSRLVKQFKVARKAPGILPAFGTLFKKQHDVISAVDNISFKITRGELVGFIGPNGAGKTTTLKCLSGLLYPTSGDIDVLGFIPVKRNPK